MIRKISVSTILGRITLSIFQLKRLEAGVLEVRLVVKGAYLGCVEAAEEEAVELEQLVEAVSTRPDSEVGHSQTIVSVYLQSEDPFTYTTGKSISLHIWPDRIMC